MPNAKEWPRLDRRAVRVARWTRGYESGTVVAKALGVPLSTFMAWEKGRNRVPPKMLGKLAKLLRVPQAELVAK